MKCHLAYCERSVWLRLEQPNRSLRKLIGKKEQQNGKQHQRLTVSWFVSLWFAEKWNNIVPDDDIQFDRIALLSIWFGHIKWKRTTARIAKAKIRQTKKWIDFDFDCSNRRTTHAMPFTFNWFANQTWKEEERRSRSVWIKKSIDLTAFVLMFIGKLRRSIGNDGNWIWRLARFAWKVSEKRIESRRTKMQLARANNNYTRSVPGA